MDAINPPHYADLSPEPIDVIEGWNLGFHRGNALKYVARAGRKDPAKEAEDLRKAVWFLEREIARLGQANDGSDRMVILAPGVVQWADEPELDGAFLPMPPETPDRVPSLDELSDPRLAAVETLEGRSAILSQSDADVRDRALNVLAAKKRKKRMPVPGKLPTVPPKTITQDPLLPLAEVAARTGLSYARLWHRTQVGTLEHVREGRKILVPNSAFQRLKSAQGK